MQTGRCNQMSNVSSKFSSIVLYFCENRFCTKKEPVILHSISSDRFQPLSWAFAICVCTFISHQSVLSYRYIFCLVSVMEYFGRAGGCLYFQVFVYIDFWWLVLDFSF
ncbi:hypothetical protein PanWU01x14_241890 [Parasponia andersonii]|uniref:Uncharacterized protein n=1 Tax=Parasponia andersonii TaxID=3476 RepID=A0A2P5BG76_PARAD|nr:hypothetical protein PanWU01x14_241890 [Parasponia andersonii]